MGLFSKLGGEFIDIIEWTQPSDSDILAYRFQRHNNEIKMGAKLTVREGQAAVFVNEGRIADVFAPGMYTLETANMPILSTIMGWKYGFSSPFKAEVYFVVTTQRTGNKWGTANPLMMRDQDFGMVRVRAFGTYVFRIVDAGAFIKEIVSTDPNFEAYEVDTQLRQAIAAKFADAVGQAKIPVLDLAGNYQKVGNAVREAIAPDFRSFGIELTQFYVENVSVPPEVEAAIDRRASMGAVGDLNAYTKFQTAEAIRDAANNPSGGAVAAGVGFGAGLGMANQMAGALQGGAGAAGGSPPPLPGAPQYYVAIEGQQTGPHTAASLDELLKSGKLTAASLVWKTGMPAWVAASTVPDLAPLLAQVPPPLPPG